MSQASLVGTDNGIIASIQPDGTASILLSYGSGSVNSAAVHDLSTAKNDHSNVFAWTADAGFATHHSADGGLTWSTPGAAESPGGNACWIARDEDGNCYSQLAGTPNAFARKSVDFGATWTSIHTMSTAAAQGNIWAGDGFLWWLEQDVTSVRVETLWRANYDGSGALSFSNDPTFMLHLGRGITRGWYGQTTLMGLQIPMLGDISDAGRRIYSIDISSPASPNLNNYVQDPFDNNTRGLLWVQPITTAIVLAVTKDYSGGMANIWRSVDGGITWGSIVSDSDIAYVDNGGGRGSTIIGSDTTNLGDVWLGNKIPFLYHSTDFGATWTKVTATGVSFGAAVEWTSVCTVPSALTYPGLARIPTFSGTPTWGPTLP